MTGAQADININKHPMGTILLIIIDLAFQTGHDLV
jgi:hypothetical protein